MVQQMQRGGMLGEQGRGERVDLKRDTRKKQRSESAFSIWWSVGNVSETEASNREHRSQSRSRTDVDLEGGRRCCLGRAWLLRTGEGS